MGEDQLVTRAKLMRAENDGDERFCFLFFLFFVFIGIQ
jgi:hypothetical protein